jgi:ferritin heavy chain
MSQIRQNFSDSSEQALNAQINIELTASYVYQTMAVHFERDDVALPGFAHFFEENSSEERQHAQKFMKYVNSRGGRVALADVKAPAKSAWATGLEALEDALVLEKKVNDSLLKLHVVATEAADAHLTDYLEGEFLTEQVDAIKELGGQITQCKRVGSGLGEFLFDKELKA